MSKILLDSSAVLAALFAEPGADAVQKYGADAAISTANYCEVLSKLLDRGVPIAEARHLLESLPLEPIPVTTTHATKAAEFRLLNRELSLGDRLCLACAFVEGLDVLTGDRQWTGLPLGIRVVLIRP